MSEETPDTRGSVEFRTQGDVAFDSLMDALAPEGEGAPGTGTGGAEGADPVRPIDGAATGSGVPAGTADPQPAVGGADTAVAGAAEAGRTADGTDAGSAEHGAVPAGSADGAAGGGAEQPAAIGEGPASWTVEPTAVVPELGGLSTAIEENLVNGYRSAAYEDARKEHTKYFEALEVHPRMLVGKQVPSLNGDGMETLKDTNDAREWQEAIKDILVQEIDNRAGTWMQDATGFMETIHASVDLFKNNTDLIPGTKGFNKELADSFASMMKPYEVRIEGRLHGYSIPVQPIIDNLRKQQAPKVSTTVKSSQQSTQAPARAPQPQRGIQSKAPTSGENEDFSTLFGTIGLPHLKI